ncbi:MAG: serine acetyltransferase [Muribaculaceae bacterium]|nr:serine acetyltransferase [Muribaculaceae bacterium]
MKLRKLFAMSLIALAGACATAVTPAGGEMPRGETTPDAMKDSITQESIVFLGNSLTYGGKWNELFGITNAVNRGIVGNTAADIDARLAEVTAGKPHKIFLMCGVNDVSHDLTADSVARAVIGLVDRIRRETPDTELFLQSLLPINNSFGRYKRVVGKEQTIRDINALLEPMARERGVEWIMLYPYFCDENQNLRADITTDGLHLTAPGYEIWREHLEPYVKR